MCELIRSRLLHTLLTKALFLSVPFGFATQLSVQAQISPGPLSKAHESISGPTQCTNCHVVGKGSAVLKCQGCHTEINAELASAHGLHGQFPNKEDCTKCHSEHNGKDFPLIHWEPSLKQFDHTRTGYALEGKHAQIACDQCHAAVHVREPQRSQIKMKDLNKTFLGLSQDCISCHQDPHKGQLGQKCLECHNFADWKAAQRFDHNKTRFPLAGLHAQVTCEKCHTPASPGGEPRFTGMAFSKCSDCHNDPHRATFAQPCETCHTTAGWKKIPQSQQFDHSKTKFPLLGKHSQTECIACHADGNFKKPLPFDKCIACHRDVHEGQFTERKDTGECGSCHSVEGWKPSSFGVKEHAASAYPLTGKHVSVSCGKCHTPAGTATRYKIAFLKCTDCHEDAHGGQDHQETSFDSIGRGLIRAGVALRRYAGALRAHSRELRDCEIPRRGMGWSRINLGLHGLERKEEQEHLVLNIMRAPSVRSYFPSTG